MSEAELLDDNPTRRADVWRVLDLASFGLFGRNLPSGSDCCSINVGLST